MNRHPRRRWGARRAPGAETVDTFARVGFAARGVVYIVIGLLAVMVGLGFGEPALDRGGALAAIAGEPFGILLLWLLVIGFSGLALWRAVQAAASPQEAGHRFLDALRAVIYAVAAWSTYEFATVGRAPASSDSSAHDVTARLLGTSGGRVLLIALALVVIGLGLAMVARAASRRFAERLRTGWMTRATREAVLRLGQIGHAARGVIVTAAGIFALVAALTDNPARAKGLDATLRSFAQTSFGPLVLVVVAVGLVAFGLYSIAEARWRRTLGGIPR
ncbi:DUF1206 domain-containing protein [Streptacidiphilus neutrinimicus]|uniref:DUF1206 domain-containing protein n=1 Tax=Streptacidiphilus neutrinimicus TaxID=105420 RepID=UPI0005AAFDDB|nr:DUF1206 domain-containing protein [Streptacidiphilus neutrinimicus]